MCAGYGSACILSMTIRFPAGVGSSVPFAADFPLCTGLPFAGSAAGSAGPLSSLHGNMLMQATD